MDLPALNATLNATSAVLLTTGWFFIKSHRIQAHRLCMISAFVTSTLFLISYSVYHLQAGAKTKLFPGTGFVRYLYFSILITHVTLAATVPVLAMMTLSRGLKKRYVKHRSIARWTLPIW